jgi:hypothetical protein
VTYIASWNGYHLTLRLWHQSVLSTTISPHRCCIVILNPLLVNHSKPASLALSHMSTTSSQMRLCPARELHNTVTWAKSLWKYLLGSQSSLAGSVGWVVCKESRSRQGEVKSKSVEKQSGVLTIPSQAQVMRYYLTSVSLLIIMKWNKVVHCVYHAPTHIKLSDMLAQRLKSFQEKYLYHTERCAVV